MEVTLPILMEVGVTPTSLAVFAPPAPPPPPPPAGPPAAPAAAPAVPPEPAVLLPADPAVPWSPPVAVWSPAAWSPVEKPAFVPAPPLVALTKALFGSLVAHACRTRARIGMSRRARYLRRAVSSGRNLPFTIPLPVTHFMARTTVGIRRPNLRILALPGLGLLQTYLVFVRQGVEGGDGVARVHGAVHQGQALGAQLAEPPDRRSRGTGERRGVEHV